MGLTGLLGLLGLAGNEDGEDDIHQYSWEAGQEQGGTHPKQANQGGIDFKVFSDACANAAEFLVGYGTIKFLAHFFQYLICRRKDNRFPINSATD